MSQAKSPVRSNSKTPKTQVPKAEPVVTSTPPVVPPAKGKDLGNGTIRIDY